MQHGDALVLLSRDVEVALLGLPSLVLSLCHETSHSSACALKGVFDRADRTLVATHIDRVGCLALHASSWVVTSRRAVALLILAELITPH